MSFEPHWLTVRNKVDLVPFVCQSNTQLGGYYTTSPKCGVTDDPYFHLSWYCIVNNLLNLRPYAGLGQFINGRRRIDAIGEKNINQLFFWVNPKHRAGKTSVPVT